MSWEDDTIGSQRTHIGWGTRGFTLIELLVAISIISLLMAIALPALHSVKRKALALIGTHNQKEIATGVNVFALDNDDRYPQSVATVGFGDNWNWSDPTKLAGNRTRSPGLYRSMSAYLRSYIPEAKVMYCPNAPRRYKYLQQLWEAGDEWDNPETSFESDPAGGTYCFYWNYIGNLGDRLFRGPRGPAGGRGYSTVVVTDYFGYGHWRSPGAYGCCDEFDGADVTPETWLLSPYWSRQGDPAAARPEITLRAGYADGHVETYSSKEAVPMKVSITSDGTVPYPDDVGPGIFCLPAKAVH